VYTCCVTGGPCVVLYFITAGINLQWVATAASIVLSFFPAPDEPHKALAVAKIAGLTLLSTGSGVVVYAFGRWRRRRRP